MNAERLLALYEKVAEAPNAIGRLRRFVLDLAVRGKLVEQDLNDEPASKLLQRIAAEKARLIKAGALKDERKPKEPSSFLALFELPQGWAWTNLQSLCMSISDGDHQPPPKSETGVPFLVIGDVRTKAINYDSERRVPQEYLDGLDPIRKPQSGDLLYTLVGSFGIPIPVLSDEPFCIQRHIAILRPSKQVDLRELALFLESEFAFKQAKAAATGIAQKTVSLAGLRSMMLPLPPLAEQQRIVAKVDELMALLDRLEAARTAREATRDRLTAASLNRLTALDTTPEVFPAHARFALDALPALTTRRDQVESLRQTILNLAVRGELVEQDPADESAESTQPTEAGFPEILPEGWRYLRLDHMLAESTRNGYSRRPDDAENGVPILRISAGTLRQDGLVAEEEHKLISGIDVDTRLQFGLQHGDLLACRFNGNKAFVGRLTLFADYLGLDPIYPDKLIRIRLNGELAIPEFIRLAGESDLVRSSIEEFCATTVGNWGISASNLKEVRFPIPPLAEQHRIVAKVDELMALCDRLEASLATADTTKQRLLEALVQQALEPILKEAA